MVNEHLSADEIVWCEQLVQEIAAIVREEKQNDQLSMQNEGGHFITLKYGGVTVHVYSEKIDIQASGSGVKSYEDGLLWTLLQENSVKDRLLEKGSEEWLSKVDAAKPNGGDRMANTTMTIQVAYSRTKSVDSRLRYGVPEDYTLGYVIDFLDRLVAAEGWTWS